jgi:hypothetical protein
MKWKAALLLLAVFLLGAASGGALGVRMTARRLGAVFEGDPRGVLPRLYVYEIDRRVGLSAEQRAQVAEIVEADHGELARIGQGLYPQLSELRARRHARIRAILTPEQWPAFDALAARQERRRREEIDLPPVP